MLLGCSLLIDMSTSARVLQTLAHVCVGVGYQAWAVHAEKCCQSSHISSCHDMHVAAKGARLQPDHVQGVLQGGGLLGEDEVQSGSDDSRLDHLQMRNHVRVLL